MSSRRSSKQLKSAKIFTR